MKRLQRETTNTIVQQGHEQRIQSLERRIPDDYPHTYSILLGGPYNLTGFASQNFGWTFGDDCSGDPVTCESDFVTSGDYLFLPTGFLGQFEVTMQAAMTSGSVANYLTPVTPGNITPSNGVKIGFVPYIATDNVVNIGTSTAHSIFVQHTQEPPPSRQGGFDRIWSHQRRIKAMTVLSPETSRWALLPFVNVFAGFGPITVDGLTMAVTLFPPGGVYGNATWAG